MSASHIITVNMKNMQNTWFTSIYLGYNIFPIKCNFYVFEHTYTHTPSQGQGNNSNEHITATTRVHIVVFIYHCLAVSV